MCLLGWLARKTKETVCFSCGSFCWRISFIRKDLLCLLCWLIPDVSGDWCRLMKLLPEFSLVEPPNVSILKSCVFEVAHWINRQCFACLHALSINRWLWWNCLIEWMKEVAAAAVKTHFAATAFTVARRLCRIFKDKVDRLTTSANKQTDRLLLTNLSSPKQILTQRWLWQWHNCC